MQIKLANIFRVFFLSFLVSLNSVKFFFIFLLIIIIKIIARLKLIVTLESMSHLPINVHFVLQAAYFAKILLEFVLIVQVFL